MDLKKIFERAIIKLGFYRRFLIYRINKLREKKYRQKARKRLTNKNFTIISNNCWGGSVYEDLGLSYSSPTIGLFFFSPCYIKFIADLKENLKAPLQFTKVSKYKKGNELLQNNTYPVGLLNNDIEIHFLHYKSEEEALEKWNRRKQRVNFQNLFLSFSDSEPCTISQIETFDKFPNKKVFFAANKWLGIKSLVHLKIYEGKQGIDDLYDNRWHYRKYFNVVNWLNSNCSSENHSELM